MSSIPKHALNYVAEEMSLTARSLFGRAITPGEARRLAERAVRAYRFAMAGKTGSRVGNTTNVLMMLKVGESVEVEATCKQNLHGNAKTARRLMSNPDLKFRFEQVEPFVWRVERRPDGAFNLNKSPERNAKAVFLAGIKVGEAKQYIGLKKSNQIVNDFVKNKARLILKDKQANWTGKAYARGVTVRRLK